MNPWTKDRKAQKNLVDDLEKQKMHLLQALRREEKKAFKAQSRIAQINDELNNKDTGLIVKYERALRKHTILCQQEWLSC